MQPLAKEQEVLMRIADMMIWTYTAESLVLRVQKLAGQRGEDAVAHEMAMMKVYCYEVAERMHSAGKEALLAFAEGDELKGMLMGLKRFTKTEPFNTTAARQSHRPEAHRRERVLLVNGGRSALITECEKPGLSRVFLFESYSRTSSKSNSLISPYALDTQSIKSTICGLAKRKSKSEGRRRSSISSFTVLSPEFTFSAK